MGLSKTLSEVEGSKIEGPVEGFAEARSMHRDRGEKMLAQNRLGVVSIVEGRLGTRRGG
jgi:hypothetical protein